MSAWQPIESAPLEKAILLFPHYMVGYWDHGGEFWRLGVDIPLTKDLKVALEFEKGNPWMEVAATAFGMPKPTHWMPLPALPKEGETQP